MKKPDFQDIKCTLTDMHKEGSKSGFAAPNALFYPLAESYDPLIGASKDTLPREIWLTSNDLDLMTNHVTPLPATKLNPLADQFNSKFISTPLRLTGGGETSFEYQENVSIDGLGNGFFMNAASISIPDSPPDCQCIELVQI